MRCGELNSLKCGSVVGNGSSYEDVRTFTCNLGYTLVGSKSKECLLNGSWNGTAAICTGKLSGRMVSISRIEKPS